MPTHEVAEAVDRLPSSETPPQRRAVTLFLQRGSSAPARRALAEGRPSAPQVRFGSSHERVRQRFERPLQTGCVPRVVRASPTCHASAQETSELYNAIRSLIVPAGFNQGRLSLERAVIHFRGNHFALWLRALIRKRTTASQSGRCDCASCRLKVESWRAPAWSR